MAATVTKITQVQFLQLEGKLTSGDRAGFYYLYYKLTGSEQALIQAQITSYSGN